MVDEASEVRALAASLGLLGLIDVHTHFMPDNVLAKVWSYFDSVGPLTGVAWPITYRFEEERRVEVLREFGVIAFTSMIYAHRPDMAAWLNAWARDFAARTPDCLSTATIYPEPSVGEYTPRAIDAGARIFKVHLQVGDFSPTDPQPRPAWGAIEESGLPVVIHCGSGPVAGRFTGPAPTAALLREFPRLRLVIAHMGMPEHGGFLDLADRYDGVHLDTTMAFTDFAEAMHPFPVAWRSRLLDHRDRIVFGSDFPNIPYSYLEALTAVQRLDLGDAWMRGVLHDNAARLLAIPR